MKTNLFKITTIILILSGSFCSCEEKINNDDSLFFEISPDSKSQVIEKELNGITFKFCLLNEQGQPATVFNEGENFIFHFDIVNKSEQDICFSTEFITADFYRVIGVTNTDMGKAWTEVWCEFRNEDMIIELPPHKEKQLNCPWFLSDNFQTDYYPLCKGESMKPLPQGEYSTALNFDFYYTIDKQQKSIKGITFKINFQIK